MSRRRPARSPRQARAGTAGSPGARARLVLAAAAIGLLALAAYAFYYLDRLPQALALDPRLDWRSEPGEAMRLRGVPPGSALSFDLQGGGAFSLSFDKGAELAPNPDAPPGRRVDDGSLVHVYALPNENVSVRAVMTDGGGRGLLHVEPGLEGDGFASLRLHSEGARLGIELDAFPNPDRREHSFIAMGPGEAPLQEARVTLPPGVGVQLRLARADLARLAVRPLRLGPDSESFPLRALETGRSGAAGFEPLALACGSPPRRLLWWRLAPAVSAGDCEPDRLTVTGFRLDRGAAATLAGSGFIVRDGATHIWPGFRDLRQNDVVKTALAILLAGLVGWAFVKLRGGRSAA
jgi:hypothetical protein